MNERIIITTQSMQADHQAWLAAHSEWQKDIDRWQAEHASAMKRLAEIQKAIQEHGECLADHSNAFRKLEESIGAHEREIAKQLSGSNTQAQDVVANHHQEQKGKFNQQKDAHERIKLHHEGVMAQLSALEASAAAPM